MYLLSGRDVRKAAASHVRSVTLRVTHSRGQVLTEADLPPLVDGTINYTEAFPRRRVSLRFEELMPGRAFINLLGANNARWEVTLDGYMQGVYYLRDFSEDYPGQNKNFRFYLSDESVLFAENRTTLPKTYEGDLIGVVEAILLNTGRSIHFAGTRNANIHLSNVFVDVDKDPWAVCSELLDKYGYEIFMSRLGYCIVRRVPTASRVFAKSLDPLVLSEQETQTRRAVNHIIVVSNVNGQQFKGEVVDDDPWSEAYYYGSSSSVPVRISVRGITSNEGCREIAESLRPVYFHRKRSKVFSMLQIPKFDFGDSFIEDDQLYRVDQVSYSLVPNRPMYLTSRGQPLAIQA